jgi:acyl-CoA reductase-like NAD-dependent aldehyde dehydrogenase
MSVTGHGVVGSIVIADDDREARSGERLDVVDPATGQPFASIPRGAAADIDDGVAAARAAQPAWEAMAPRERGACLLALAARIREHRDELGRLETRDVGKPLHQGVDDADCVADYFAFYGEAADKLYGDRIGLPGGFALTEHVAHGVTGHIIPWNFPMALVGRTLAPALAMGNASVLKPPEDAPLTSIRIGQLARDAGFPPGVLNVVPGLGQEAGAALAAHPDVDHVSFTGSRAVGISVMQASAPHTRPVMLELGGKSPSVVFRDADLELMVPVLQAALLTNCGQTCNAGTRVLVESALHDELVEALVDRMGRLRIGAGLDDPDLGPLISSKQLERVAGYVDVGRSEGARVVLGGGRPEGLGGGYFYQPTIIESRPEHRVAQEEIFGPVLTVIDFDGIDEAAAIAIANGTGYDLAAAVWTQDIDRAFRLASRLRAGQVYVNNWGLGSGIDTPFGGFRGSGFGREKGIEAMREFSAVRTTVVRVAT